MTIEKMHDLLQGPREVKRPASRSHIISQTSTWLVWLGSLGAF